MIPPIFARQPVIIVAGGPSLMSLDWPRLAGKNTIAINRALEFVPDATILWWSDAMFWRKHRDAILAHKAKWKATGNLEYATGEIPPEVHEYRPTGLIGFDPIPGRYRHGNNSGFAAIHLAAQLGAGLIITLGLDMQYGPNKESHFHGGHGVCHSEVNLRDHMKPYFTSLLKPLADRGIAVLNASEHSALRVWPRCSITEGLAAYDRFTLSAGIGRV